MVTIDVSTGHLIAAGRYRRIPAGHDALGIASGDARRRKKTLIEYLKRDGEYLIRDGEYLIRDGEYLIRDGVTHRCACAEQQRIALLWRRRPR
jgi:hypothetical protein